MIILKYQKVGTARFISHIDLLKHMARIIRRADIPVKFSQGFNPHELLYFSAPSVLGINSNAEYISIDTDLSKEETLARYNASVPDTIKATKAFESIKNPNIQGLNVSADYIFNTAYFDIDLGNGFKIKYLKKDDEVEEDVCDKIYKVFNANGKLGLTLASGNTNLRPDRIIPALNEKYALDLKITDVLKTAQYVKVDGKIVDVDYYLENNF